LTQDSEDHRGSSAKRSVERSQMALNNLKDPILMPYLDAVPNLNAIQQDKNQGRESLSFPQTSEDHFVLPVVSLSWVRSTSDKSLKKRSYINL